MKRTDKEETGLEEHALNPQAIVKEEPAFGERGLTLSGGVSSTKSLRLRCRQLAINRLHVVHLINKNIWFLVTAFFLSGWLLTAQSLQNRELLLHCGVFTTYIQRFRYI